jgi:hypothetical protein
MVVRHFARYGGDQEFEIGGHTVLRGTLWAAM